MASQTVGFVGVGAMGSRMAPHIANAGFPVHVFDIDTEAAETLARTHNGIVAEPSARAVAAADHQRQRAVFGALGAAGDR